MKKFFLLLLIVGGGVYAYFWYIRGINLLQLEDSNPLPLYGMAVRLYEKNPDPTAFKWYSAMEMPSPRSGMSSAAIGSHLYVFGGVDGFGRTSAAVEMYDTKSDAWTTLRPLPHPVKQSVAVQVDGKIYLLGGFEGLAEASTSYTQVYDIESNTWSEGKQMPYSVGGAAAAAADGIVHVMGGNSNGIDLQSHYAYDPVKMTWSQEEEMIIGREQAASAMLGGKLYVFGGRQGSLAYNIDSVDMFDFKRNAWETIGLMPRKRSDMTVLVFGGKAYVFGGEAPTVTFADVDVFDPVGNKWTTLPQRMPHPRHGLVGAVTDGAFFLIGGGQRPGLSVSSLNEVLQAPQQAQAPAK